MEDNSKEKEISVEVKPESDQELKGKVVSGVFWRFLERFLAQGIGFIVSIFLARMLSVDDYGSVALILIFVTIADVFLSSGFSIALIRKKQISEADLSSVFYLNLGIALVLYAAIFFSAPGIEIAFKTEGLTWLLRIIALKLPFSALNTIQIAIATNQMRFKMFFFATLGGTIASAVVGITMAYNGMGAWSLVAQHLTNLVIDTLILSIFVRWRPHFVFSKKSIKEMAPFSIRNMGTDLSGQVFNYLNQFVVGLRYTTEDLGYMSKGQQLPNMLNVSIVSTINSVLFPAISRVSDNTEKVKKAVRKSVKTLSFILVPMMVGLAVVSQELTLFLYTAKWSGMVIYMQLMCLTVIFQSIGAFDITALKAIGKTRATLILEFINKPICLGLTIVAMFYGVLPIAIAATVYSFVALIINSFATYKYMRYSFWEKIADILIPLLSSIGMGALVFGLKNLPLSNTILLFIEIGAGLVSYFLLAFVTKNEVFLELLQTFKRLLLKRKTS